MTNPAFRFEQVIGRRRFLACVVAANVSPALFADSVSQRWPDELSVGPFRYHANYSLQSDTKLLQQIAGLHRRLPQELEIPERDREIHVYLFSQRATYENYLARYFTDVPQRRALFIKQGGPGMVFAYRSREFATDVRHETTHAVLHNALPFVPLWIDEGLAEHYEVPAANRLKQNPHMRKVLRDAGRHKLPSLKKLENITQLSAMGADEYRDAFAWMHFCLHGPKEARAVLRNHLHEIAEHRPPGSFAERMMANVPDVEYRYFSHYRAMAA
ncbi:MAG: hypothetical protein KDB27_03495 [Planctomycetales bacterium]|nr:hypothetical protein [Planctomycetales bacterium]